MMTIRFGAAIVLVALATTTACSGNSTGAESRSAGRQARRHADDAQTEGHLLRALQMAEQERKPEAIAEALDDLTQLYIARDDLPRAEGFCRRALEVRERVLPADAKDITRTVDRLAWFALQQDRFDEAASLYERALAAQERTAGPEHEDTATALDRLAYVYGRQERFEEGLRTYQRSLKIREAHAGPNKKEELADTLERMANLYLTADRPEEAERLLVRAVDIRESAPLAIADVAESHRRLAVAHVAQKEYAEAEASLLRAMTLLEHTPPKGATEGGLLRLVLEHYAGVLAQTGRRDEAERMKARAKALRAQARASEVE